MALADLLGYEENLKIVKAAFAIQGESNYHFFITKLCEIFEIETREIQSYIIYIYERLIFEDVFYLDPDIEEAERLFFKYYLPGGRNLRDLNLVLLEKSEDIQDLTTIIQCFQYLGEELISEEFTIKIVSILEKKSSWICKVYGKNFFETYSSFFYAVYEFLKEILESLAEDGNLEYEREIEYFIARRNLLLFVLFLHHLGIGEIEEIKENFYLTFQNLSSKNLKLEDSPSFFLILNLKSDQTATLELFHIMVLRIHSKVN